MALSNQNLRTTAILKVIGLYLVAIIILAFLFSENKGERSECSNENKTLKAENAKLKELVFQLDSLTTLTSQIIDLDQKVLDDPEKYTPTLRELEIDLEEVQTEIIRLGRNDEGSKKKNAIAKNVIGKLTGLRSTTNILRSKLKDLVKVSKEEMEDQEREITDEVEGEVTGLETDNESLDQQLTNCQDELVKKGDALTRCGEEIQALEVKIQDISTRVDGIKADAEAAVRTDPLIGSNKWKVDIPSMKIKLEALKNFIDQK